MTIKTGVGYIEMTHSRNAGIAASKIALENGKLEKADFSLIFCSGKHNPHEFLAGVNSILGDVPKIGGIAMGIITNKFHGYEGFEAGVTVFSSDTVTFKIFAQGELNLGEAKAGAELGKKISDKLTQEDQALLFFYDSSKQQNPPLMNFATLLIQGLESFLPKRLTCAGGGLLGDMQLSPCYQFYNNEVLTQHVVAVLIGGTIKMHTTIMHGCRPASPYLTITKSSGPIVLEINNRPALDVIDELLGKEHTISWKEFAFFITLGLNKGDKFGEYDEKLYTNRLTLAVDEELKALIMFEPDLKQGDEVQLMRRSVDLKYIKSNFDELKIKSGNSKPHFYFYINCAGRAKPYSGGEYEDAEEVQKATAELAPLMGFYSGVEVGQVGESLQPLDWSGVLCMFSE